MNEALPRSLVDLARAYGVQTRYAAIDGGEQVATVEALIAVLRALGAHVGVEEDAAAALVQRETELAGRILPPYVVAWQGQPTAVEMRFGQGPGPARLTLDEEGGAVRSWDVALDDRGTATATLPGDLPTGYHRLVAEAGARSSESLVIAAPNRMWSPENPRLWGLFAPTYALHSERTAGIGDYTDLQVLARLVADRGGSIVGTLPLLPTFLDALYSPSPYSPVSRRMWSELYVDPAQAGATLAPSSNGDLVDYRTAMSARRDVLQPLADVAFDGEEPTDPRLAAFLTEHPLVEEYARFRATCDRQRTAWRAWPASLQHGGLDRGDYDESDRRFYAYAQWQAHQQVEQVASDARERGVHLYLDLPVGSHPDGFDTWQNPSAYALDVSVGAPPDPLGPAGQDWGFPPFRPDALAAQRFEPFIEIVRHHLRHAGMLRLDHVMGLYRLFWIPHGMPAGAGVYVHYPADALFAILAIESHRHQAIIVGEDLGTVPDEVREAMETHGAWRMYVAAFSLTSDRSAPLQTPPSTAIASLNTHDLPPFAAMLSRLEAEELHKFDALICFLRDRGLLDPDENSPAGIATATLDYLSASDAPALLVNSEDLWGETESQNVPGTTDEFPNWRRRLRLSLEEMAADPAVARTLARIAAHRPDARTKGVA